MLSKGVDLAVKKFLATASLEDQDSLGAMCRSSVWLHCQESGDNRRSGRICYRGWMIDVPVNSVPG